MIIFLILLLSLLFVVVVVVCRTFRFHCLFVHVRVYLVFLFKFIIQIASLLKFRSYSHSFS